MKLTPLEGSYSVYRFGAGTGFPDGIETIPGFVSVTRTPEELSVVCLSGSIRGAAREEEGWVLWKVQGPLDFGLTGVLSSIASPLAAAGVSIFAVSTYDTDYILWKKVQADRAERTLRGAGFQL